MNSKKTLISSAISLAFGLSVNSAYAAQVTVGTPFTTQYNNFTSLAISNEVNTLPSVDGIGLGTGNYWGAGANNLTVSWDGTVYTASSDIGAASNMTITNTELFFGHVWTMSNIQVFGPGTYSFVSDVYPFYVNTSTVGAGQLMAHMDFSWNGSTDMDTYVLWNTSTGGCFGDCTTQLWTNSGGSTGSVNPGGNTFGTYWDWVTIDTIGVNGPFPRKFSFNIHGNAVNLPAAVPLPPAVWLFGSGLMGLASVMCRKKKL